MDVRMLGSGRPFVLEIANARAAMPALECFEQMADSLNQSGVGVEVRKLQPVGKDVLKLIKVRMLDGKASMHQALSAVLMHAGLSRRKEALPVC